MRDQEYIPISCSFHDVLLHHATIGDEVDLVFLEGNEQVSFKTTFQDVLTEKGEEFLLISDQRKIRLDFIVSVNGKKMPKVC